MKVFFIICFTILSCRVYAQNIYMRSTSESDKDGTTFIILNPDGQGTRNAYCSYSTLKGTMINFMVKWGVGTDGMIYWTNGDTTNNLESI